MPATEAAEPVEDVDTFRRVPGPGPPPTSGRAERRQLEVSLKAKLERGGGAGRDRPRAASCSASSTTPGFAGVCVPQAYGGQGLTPEHQRALNEAFEGYEFPVVVPGADAFALHGGDPGVRYRGAEAPPHPGHPARRGAVDAAALRALAAARTWRARSPAPCATATSWILNGSKIWTTGAWWSDWGLCLARTNWEVPKHRGLTVFMLPLRQPGVEIHRIEMLNGNREFCQEFFTDVVVPDTDRIGEVDDGWTVGVRWMFHERMLYDSPLVTFPVGVVRTVGATSLTELARAVGRQDDPTARELIGEARMLDIVADKLQERIGSGMRSGAISEQAAAIPRLFKGTSTLAAADHRLRHRRRCRGGVDRRRRRGGGPRDRLPRPGRRRRSAAGPPRWRAT